MEQLRSYTTARVGLRRAGTSLATSELLDMAQCLAEARDAVHAELSTASLMQQLAGLDLQAVSLGAPRATGRSICGVPIWAGG